jgi:DNA-binding CsgD family transcriptional regulator
VKQIYRRTGNTTKNGITTVRYVHLVILSDQERAIVWMLVLGVSRKDIAATLKIGAETLKTHIARVMGPLHLYGMTQLTRWALTHQGSMAGEAVSPDLHPAGCEVQGRLLPGHAAGAEDRDAYGGVAAAGRPAVRGGTGRMRDMQGAAEQKIRRGVAGELESIAGSALRGGATRHHGPRG